MHRFFSVSAWICAAALAAHGALAQAVPKMSVDDLLAVKWVSDLTLSSAGDKLAFSASYYDAKRKQRVADIYLLDVKTRALRQLTRSGAKDTGPAFSPDGKTIAFVSSRHQKQHQLYTIAIDGGEAERLTDLCTEVSGPALYSPDGKLIAFVSSVYPDCADDACNKRRLKADKDRKASGLVIDELLYRHWNEFRGARRAHIFVVGAKGGRPKDLTPGPSDAPPLALGGDRDYDFSPDSKFLAYASNTDKQLATSTNNDIFEVAVTGGQPRRITTGQGNDTTPRYSPDGAALGYLSMARAGFESDRPRVVVFERRSQKSMEWSRGFDGHPLGLLWDQDGRTLYFNAPHQGFVELFAVTKDAVVKQLSHKLYAKGLNLQPKTRQLFFVHERAEMPPEVYALTQPSRGAGQLTRLTSFNGWLTQKLGLRPAEHVWYAGSNGDKVHAVLVTPPGFRPTGRYPALVMIHGGPQGWTGDSFHPRWNLQMFASAGFVVFGINFHGSVGFGQAFVDAIRGDWGGKPYEDIMKGTEHLAAMPFVDKNRICAAGGSYGGYMVNWIATQTKRFRCLISHAGLYNIESKYGSTDELWFPEWEFRGTPWTHRDLYRKFSPHAYAERLATPTLVIHGQKDYRVPVEQALQMFTALKRQKVPARLLYFPDEDHFVQKPDNVRLWWQTMWDWLRQHAS